jgi:putative heme-binding domain-containing protein
MALALATILFVVSLHASVSPTFKTGAERTTEITEITEKNTLFSSVGSVGSVRSVVDFKLTHPVFLQAGPTQSAAIPTGARLFRERCADCHGAEAKGDRGPDLTGLWTSEAADGRAFQIIRSGVAGSIMPPSQATDEEIRAVIAYLRSISTTAGSSAARGNVANGEKTFWVSCGGCHHVNGRGGRLGPDLSRIASSQSRDALRQSIRDASASITSGYEAVTLVTRDRRRIRGVRKGEDAFSIQIMDTRERLQGFLKGELSGVSRDPQSLMPSFAVDRLSDSGLDDLLDFLATLRSSATPGGGQP